MEGTSSDAVVTEPMQGVVVAAEDEHKRQRTVSGLPMIHELEQIAVPCGASFRYLCGSMSESRQLQPFSRWICGAKTGARSRQSATRTADINMFHVRIRCAVLVRSWNSVYLRHSKLLPPVVRLQVFIGHQFRTQAPQRHIQTGDDCSSQTRSLWP